MKKNTKKNKSFSLFQSSITTLQKSVFLCALGVFWVVFAADYLSDSLDYGIATASGSNNSLISIVTDTGSPGSVKEAKYWNKWDNSTIIDNFFTGYYFDSSYGFFRLDWSANQQENIRVVSSTSACPTGYGYKIGGYARSEYFWFIDFDYSSSVYVYYCESDKKMHGYGYSETLGFQNFEGISFDIIPNIGGIAETTSSGIFVNDTTSLPNIGVFSGGSSNFDYNSLFGDTFSLDATKESIFYIIK
jgi:hypothetical protein